MAATGVIRQPAVEATPQVKEKLDTIDSSINTMNDDLSTILTMIQVGVDSNGGTLSAIHARQLQVQNEMLNNLMPILTAIDTKLQALIDKP